MKLLRTQGEMVQAYRDRIRELGLTHGTVDAISGLPDGYTSKLMSDPPMKNLGQKAIEMLNGALGIAFVVTVDSQAAKLVRGRWTRRRRPLAGDTALASRFSIDDAALTEAEIKVKMQHIERMKMLGSMGGKKGGKRRLKTMKKRARQAAATHAARVRWSKEKRA